MNRGSTRILFGGAFILVLLAAAVWLDYQGRLWWCACAAPTLWEGDIWSAHNSQHLLDPYSFTHVLHGVLLCGITYGVSRWVSVPWRLWLTVCAEALWEVLENSPFIIQRYREATIGLGYEGDSILNSMGDIGCCALGFLLARRLGFRGSMVLFVVTELVLLVWVRDNLTLNVWMLTYPVEAVKSWQMGD